jgi:adenosine/AMP kinase
VRWSGNDEAALALARDNALAIGAGHTFLIFLGDGFFPVKCWPRCARCRRSAASIARPPTRHR